MIGVLERREKFSQGRTSFEAVSDNNNNYYLAVFLCINRLFRFCAIKTKLKLFQLLIIMVSTVECCTLSLFLIFEFRTLRSRTRPRGKGVGRCFFRAMDLVFYLIFFSFIVMLL